MPQEPLVIEDLAGPQEGQRVLRLTGPLVLSTLFDFQAKVRTDNSRTLMIDFTKVPYVDSAGIGALVGAYVTHQKDGRSLYLIGREPTGSGRDEDHSRPTILQLCGLSGCGADQQRLTRSSPPPALFQSLRLREGIVLSDFCLLPLRSFIGLRGQRSGHLAARSRGPPGVPPEPPHT